MQTTLPKYC